MKSLIQKVKNMLENGTTSANENQVSTTDSDVQNTQGILVEVQENDEQVDYNPDVVVTVTQDTPLQSLLKELNYLDSEDDIEVVFLDVTPKFGVGDLELSLQKQVTVDETKSNNKVTINLYPLDNYQTIYRKIEICKERLEDIKTPLIDRLRGSENLSEVLKGYFHEDFKGK